MEIGPSLRTAREKQAISLEVAEKETKIRKKYLIALEEENFDIIPGKVYVRGFLRNYARFLGLDGEDFVAQYNNYVLSVQESVTVEENIEEGLTFTKKNQHRFTWAVVVGLLLFAGIVVLAYGMPGGGDAPGSKVSQDSGKISSPHTDSAQVNKGREQERLASANGNNTINRPVNSKGVNLVLTFNGRCWMEVKVDKKKIFEGFAYAGESKEFSGQENIAVHVGDAGVVKAKVNGVEKGFLGRKGDVVKKTFRAEKKADT